MPVLCWTVREEDASEVTIIRAHTRRLPRLVAQLDRKNGALAPERIAHRSRASLWWRCPAGPDHLWQAPPDSRTRLGSGCPFCAGRALSVTNALSTISPTLAQQWHPTKNGALRPRNVVVGSHLVVWWKCPKGPDHEWTAKVVNRSWLGRGCPFCSGRRPTAARNLAAVYPRLAEEWHPTKNGALRPNQVAPSSRHRVWWRCAGGHAWPASPNARVSHGCPYCAGRAVAPERSLAARHLKLARTWHRTKNGTLTPRDVTPGSTRRVWWKCPKGPDHEWQTIVVNRVRAGCPFCAGQRVSVTNALAARHPKLAREWHPSKNCELTNPARRDVRDAASRVVALRARARMAGKHRRAIVEGHGLPAVLAAGPQAPYSDDGAASEGAPLTTASRRWLRLTTESG